MSHNGRQAVWEILKDRRWHRVDDVRESYPQWYSGLASLVEWGWALDYRAEKKLVRLLPVSPTTSPVLKTLEVLEWARDLPPLPKEPDEQDELDALAERPDGHEELQTLGGGDDGQDSGRAEEGRGEGADLEADEAIRAGFEQDVEEARDARRRVRDVLPEDGNVGAEGAGDAPASGASAGDVDGEGLSDLDRVRDEEGPAAPEGAAADGDAEPVAERVEGVQEEIRFAAALRTGTLTLDQSHVTQTCGILATKGSGKSYTAMVIAEEMLEYDLPFSVLDPTGAWWGLRCGADGDPEGGYPLVVAGGDHGDVELAEHDGGIVAQYLVERYPTQLLCDLSLMTPDEQHQFGFDFASVLFHHNRRAMHVFVDEVDEMASQRPQDSLEQKCLNAFDRLVRRGRIRGIGLTGITQRSAVWSKNMLSQVGSLIVLKTGAPQDIKAIEGWVAKVMSGDEVKTFLSSLGGLKKGEAWYVLPGSKPLARRIRVRKRRTYDSSRTPEVGEDVRDPRLRHVDAGDLRAFLDSRRHEVLAELAENEGEG